VLWPRGSGASRLQLRQPAVANGGYCCKSRHGAAVDFKFETIESGRAHF
jgi:hypothetical protein